MNDIEFDETKKYYDFYLVQGQPKLVEIGFEGFLEKLVNGQIAVDNSLKKHMTSLSRWTVEAPRKRNLRKMRMDGIMVLTSDVLFEEEGGEEVIQNLENTGTFAKYFLKEVYGVS